MEENFDRLCPGTFFDLIREAGYPRKRVWGKENENTDPNCLFELIRVMDPGYEKPSGGTFAKAVSHFKKCEDEGKNVLPFEDENFYRNLFEVRRFNRPGYLAPHNMNAFILKYVDVKNYGDWLASALIELILRDKTIDDEEIFLPRIPAHGDSIRKRELETLNEVRLTALMSGIIHYLLHERIPNNAGRATYLRWYEPVGKGQPDKFKSNAIGNDIHVTCLFSEKLLDQEGIEHPDETGPVLNIENYRNYLAKARGKYGKVKTLLYSEQPCDLNSIYVNGTLCCDRSYHAIRSGLITDVTPGKLIRISPYVIITGTGGLGKSMMMKHLFIQAADSIEEYQRLPIFVALNNYDPNAEPLFEYVFRVFHALDTSSTKEELNRLLLNGCCLLLLDGLDEISSDSQQVFEKQFELFTDTYDSNQYVMSSRPYTAFTSFTRFRVAELQKLTKEEALELIDKLEFRPDEPAIKAEFRDKLDTELYRTHQDFASNPLLLTIMLMTFEQFAEIPSKMHIFYHEAYEALAKRHDATKGGYKRALRTKLSAEQFADYFAEFCAKSYMKEKFDFSQQQFRQTFDKLKIVQRNPGKVEAPDFAYDLTANMCLMYYEGMAYHFTHRSFQEYFCAVFFSRQKDKVLKKIGKLFETKHNRSFSDQTFAMLYDMIPEKVEEYIFLPFLEEIFDGITDFDDIEFREDSEAVDICYKEFLERYYPECNYYDGEVPDWDETTPASFIYKFIIDLKHLDHYDLVSGELPYESGFVKSEYIDFDPRAWRMSQDPDGPMYDPDNLENPELTDVTELPSGLDYCSTDIVGSLLSFDTSDVLNNPNQYPKLYSALMSSTFPLREEFEAVWEYYNELKHQVRDEDEMDDFMADME
jgi:hypothetical protein